MKWIPTPLRIAASAWTALFMVVLFLAPMIGLLRSLSLDWETFTDPILLSVVRMTATQAALSTVLSIAFGGALGLWMARGGRALSPSLRSMLLFPFGVPTVVVAGAWVALLGRSGWLGATEWLYSLKAVVLAHVFLNVPWIASTVADLRRGVPQAHLEAARTLGAGPLSCLGQIIWPYIRWGLASGAAQVFSLCCMSFVLVLILGGGPPVETLETSVYSRIRFAELDIPGATACAAWQLLLTVPPWLWVVAYARRDQASRMSLSRFELRSASRRSARAVDWRVMVAAVFVAPYVALLWTPVLATEEFWREIAEPAKLSLMISGSTALLSVGTALTAIVAGLHRSPTWVQGLVGLPSAVSALVLGLAIWIAYGSWVDPFEGSLSAIVGIQAVLFFPLALRVLWPIALQSRRPVLEAARTLGASPAIAFWMLDRARWSGPVMSALAMVAAASLGEVAAVSLFYSENLVPLPLIASRWMAQYRFEAAQAVLALLLILAAGVARVAAQSVQQEDAC